MTKTEKPDFPILMKPSLFRISLSFRTRGKNILGLFLLCFGLSFFARARSDIRFDNYTINEGLSQSAVNCILQDDRGFIWAGTQDGLNRFDGYEFRIFKHEPGDSTSLSDNFIQTLYQDKEGMIWVGTEKGLNRFNPKTQQFKQFLQGPLSDTTLSDDQIRVLEGNGNGTIWVGTSNGGVYRFLKDSSSFRRLPFDPSGKRGVPSNAIHSLYLDQEGLLWIGTAGEGLCRYNTQDSSFRVFNDETRDRYGRVSLPDDEVLSVTRSPDGDIWAGTNKGAVRLVMEEQGYRSYHYSIRDGLEHPVVRDIYCDRKGKIWLGTDGGGLVGVNHLSKGNIRITTFRHSYYEPHTLSNDRVNVIFEDRTASIWVGTRRGLSKFDRGKQNFEHLTYHVDRPKGLNDKSVWSIFHEPEKGVLWVGTSKGLNRIDREREEYQYLTGLLNKTTSDQTILSICRDSRDRLWIGTVTGFFRIMNPDDPQKVTLKKIPYREEKPGSKEGEKVYEIYEDRQGYLWIGTRDGLSRLDPETGGFHFFRRDPFDDNSLSHNLVRDVYQDTSGTFWVATDGGGLNKIEVEPTDTGDVFHFEHIRSREEGGLSSDMVVSLWEEQEENALWIGTYGGGLNRFDKETGEVRVYTQNDGLPNNVVYGVLGDEQGNLWMSTNQGLSKFDIDKEQFQNYQRKDGLQSNEFNTGAYFGSSSGELFFGGINGLNAFHPEAINPNPYPPQVVLTELILFNDMIRPGERGILEKHISMADRAVLSYDMDNITLHFAALHYSYSGNNRYKYIMEGFDKDTIQAGTKRSAQYTNLDPGEYTFKVFGSNSDGVWSEKPAVLHIIVEPPFWMTWWFRGLMAILFLGGIYGLYQYRMSIIKIQKRKLEVEVQKRTRQIFRQKERIEEQKKLLEKEKNKVEEQKKLLQEEKEKVDKLVANILPEDTANELKTGGKASARHYDLASVIFTDFQGFTNIAENMEPNELLARLDSYFIQFDRIIERWELEKIKTIGDSYMAVGGIPIRNKTNPIYTVLAGLEIQDFLEEQKGKLQGMEEQNWEARIGIHTGPLIAGVIGIKRYAYDIWGDTVNVASRMESSGEIGEVNISGETYQWVEPYFDCVYRGKVAAKNKGHIDMYFVKGIKEELSIGGKKKEPNNAFWDYVNLHFYSKINYAKAEKHLLKVLEKYLPDNLYYHDIGHTKDVCQAVERLAFMEGIKGEDLFLLKTAALFHDAGFVEQYDNNETIGMKMAEEILPKYGYTDTQIQVVRRLIGATEVPHDPQDHLEEILCDADLDYLGRDDFHEIADTLKQELMDRDKIRSEREWDELQVKFLKMHKYFTPSAIKLRKKKKGRHLKEVQERLKGVYPDEVDN